LEKRKGRTALLGGDVQKPLEPPAVRIESLRSPGHAIAVYTVGSFELFFSAAGDPKRSIAIQTFHQLLSKFQRNKKGTATQCPTEARQGLSGTCKQCPENE